MNLLQIMLVLSSQDEQMQRILKLACLNEIFCKL